MDDRIRRVTTGALPPIIVPIDRRWQIAFALASPLLFAFGSWLALGWPWTLSPRGWLICAACLAVGAFGSALSLDRLVRPRPAVILDEQGFTDNLFTLSTRFVPWVDVTGAGVTMYKGMRYLGLDLSESHLARAPLGRRWLMKSNRKLFGYPVLIAQTALAMPVETLVMHVGTYRHSADIHRIQSRWLRSTSVDQRP